MSEADSRRGAFLVVKSGLPARFATPESAPATATAAITAATASEASASAAPLFARTRFIHVDCAAVHLTSVQCIDCVGCLGGIGHFHKSKAARLSGVPIANDTHTLDSAVLPKSGLELALGYRIREVSHENIRHFCQLTPELREGRFRLFTGERV
jgi:hypothetical protein